jgi:hypothetical protein
MDDFLMLFRNIEWNDGNEIESFVFTLCVFGFQRMKWEWEWEWIVWIRVKIKHGSFLREKVKIKTKNEIRFCLKWYIISIRYLLTIFITVTILNYFHNYRLWYNIFFPKKLYYFCCCWTTTLLQSHYFFFRHYF